ncbi:MAG: hypothetical protein RL227_1217 [Pseudomonadota bacterium]|jgi:hypothetical protein
MRWKLLRRRLSVSAPRVIVRSHLPWPLRWAVAAVVLGFSGALALWAFETGKDLAGLEGDAKQELAQLRVEVQGLRGERDRAQSLANAADGLLKAEKAAQERLAQDLRMAQSRQQSLEADLGFFQRLLPVTAGQPLQLRALQAESRAPGQTRYQMLVMQPGKSGAEFSGRYDILLDGALSGQPWRMSLPGGPQALTLRQYARVEGLIEHPPGVVLKTVQARVLDAQGVVRATETLRLP